MTPAPVRVGTRGSLLARTQSGTIAASLAALVGGPCELVTIRSEGDDPRVPLDAPSRPGIFVATLRDAVLRGEVDLVIHSYKDLPTAAVPGLVVAAVPEREAADDVLVTASGARLGELEPGARVGTSSPRRAAALRRARPDLVVQPVRGNVDTRLRLVADGALDAVVLALAGLHRLGRLDPAWQVLTADVVVPAPAQGALAVECREDSPLLPVLRRLADPRATLEVTAERAVLRGVDAACTTAIGAYAACSPGRLTLVAELSGHRGVDYARRTAEVELPDAGDPGALGTAERLGTDLAADLLAGAS